MIAIELFCIAELENRRKYLGLDKNGNIVVFYCNVEIPLMSYVSIKGVSIDDKPTYKLLGCLKLLEVSETELLKVDYTEDILNNLKEICKCENSDPSYIIPIIVDLYKEDLEFMYTIFKLLKIDLDYILHNFKKGEIKCQ